MGIDLLRGYIQRQSCQEPLEWIVVDSGHQQTLVEKPSNVSNLVCVDRTKDQDRSLNRNIVEALRHISYEKVVFMEDDDWYSPNYLREMSDWLDQAELVGEGRAKYYNVQHRCFHECKNKRHASLAQTGFRSSLAENVSHACQHEDPYIDTRLWDLSVNKYISEQSSCCVGIKGIPGRPGYGIGHRPTLEHLWHADPAMSRLRQWVGQNHRLYEEMVTHCFPIPWMQDSWSRLQDWMIVGKGPSFNTKKIRAWREKGGAVLGLNHVCRETPVDLTHIIDFDVVEDLGEVLSRNSDRVIMPWIPHEGFKISCENLLEYIKESRVLSALSRQGRLYTYPKGDDGQYHSRSREIPIPVTYFSAEAAVGLLGAKRIRDLRMMGVDGGTEYSEAFSDLPVLRNGQRNFDVQFKNIQRMAKRCSMRIRKLEHGEWKVWS